MNPGKSRDEILSAIAPTSQLGDRLIHVEFDRQTRSGRLTADKARALVEAARRDGPVQTREILCLTDICDYAQIVAEARDYLIVYTALASFLIKNANLHGVPLYSDGVPLGPITDKARRSYVEAIASAARLPLQFTFPDAPGRLYMFRSLALIAKLLRHGYIFMFALRTPHRDTHGGYAPLFDAFYVAEQRGMSASQRASTAVHEAMHAVQDCFFYNSDTGHKEAAAHLVQAVWLLSRSSKLYGRLDAPAIREVAETMAEAARGTATMLYEIDAQRYKAIRAVLASVRYGRGYSVREPGPKTSGVRGASAPAHERYRWPTK